MNSIKPFVKDTCVALQFIKFARIHASSNCLFTVQLSNSQDKINKLNLISSNVLFIKNGERNFRKYKTYKKTLVRKK